MSFPDIPAASQRNGQTHLRMRSRRHTQTHTHHTLYSYSHKHHTHHTHTHTHNLNRILIVLSLSPSLSPHYLFPFSPSSGMFLHFLSRMQIGRNTDQNLLQNGAFLRGKKRGVRSNRRRWWGGGDLREGNDAWWRRWEN